MAPRLRASPRRGGANYRVRESVDDKTLTISYRNKKGLEASAGRPSGQRHLS